MFSRKPGLSVNKGLWRVHRCMQKILECTLKMFLTNESHGKNVAHKGDHIFNSCHKCISDHFSWATRALLRTNYSSVNKSKHTSELIRVFRITKKVTGSWIDQDLINSDVRNPEKKGNYSVGLAPFGQFGQIIINMIDIFSYQSISIFITINFKPLLPHFYMVKCNYSDWKIIAGMPSECIIAHSVYPVCQRYFIWLQTSACVTKTHQRVSASALVSFWCCAAIWAKFFII